MNLSSAKAPDGSHASTWRVPGEYLAHDVAREPQPLPDQPAARLGGSAPAAVGAVFNPGRPGRGVGLARPLDGPRVRGRAAAPAALLRGGARLHRVNPFQRTKPP